MEDSETQEETSSKKEAGSKKTAAKTRRPRTRTAKPASRKKSAAATPAETTQEMNLDTAASPSREPEAPAAPEVTAEPSTPSAPANTDSEPKRYSFEPAEPAEPSSPAPEAPAENAPSAEQSSSAPAPVGNAPAEPAAPEAQQAPQQYPQHQNRPQHHGQHGGGNEPFWKRDKHDKRNKRNRGRHGNGNWQQGQGGPQHPAQPPPPELTPSYGDLPNPAEFANLAALEAKATEITSAGGEPVYLDKLYALNLGELTAEARRLGVTFEGAPNRKQALAEIFKQLSAAKRPILDRGWIDLTDKGYGFIVHEAVNYRLYPEDAYLPESLVFKFGLKRGHQVEVLVRAPVNNERCPSVVRVDKVMGIEPAEISKVKPFEDLIPYYPLQRILLEAPEVHKDISMRAVDILTPIGFGQRGLIVAPPRTGKTVLLQNMANSISNNFPETKLILLLIDERPEEVTDFKRHTKGEVVSSTFDESPESHVHCAEMVGEKARRLVEAGQHVVILLDSITRLARAYNALASNSGKIMSGGMEATALQKPKRFFGAARNIEGGGSLTIIATALIDTGSRMDEVIFEEFKGTGNMELHLDRGLVDKRIFPAINMDRSGTRKEELIYHPDEMLRIYGLRRAMQGIPPVEAMEMLITRLKKTKTNAEFLMGLNR
jgi:transcription termination factor Rho